MMDGITATKVIHQIRSVYGARIIDITAFALEGDCDKCLEAGMDDYIIRPVKLDDLKEALERFSPILLRQLGMGPSTKK